MKSFISHTSIKGGQDDSKQIDLLFKSICPPGKDRLPLKYFLKLLRMYGFHANMNDLQQILDVDQPIQNFLTLRDFDQCFFKSQAEEIVRRIVQRTIKHSTSEVFFRATSFSSLIHHICFMKKRDIYLQRIKNGGHQLSDEYNEYMILLKQSAQDWISSDNSISGYTLPQLVPSHYRVQQQLLKYERHKAKTTPTIQPVSMENFFLTSGLPTDISNSFDPNSLTQQMQKNLSIVSPLNSPTGTITLKRQASHQTLKIRIPQWDTTLKIGDSNVVPDETLPHSILRNTTLKQPFHKPKLLSPPRSILQSLDSLSVRTMMLRRMKMEKTMNSHVQKERLPYIYSQNSKVLDPSANDTLRSVEKSTQTIVNLPTNGNE